MPSRPGLQRRFSTIDQPSAATYQLIRAPIGGMVPTADPNRRGGTRLDALVGRNLYAPKDTKLKGHRLAIEGGIPIAQHLEGPQLETDWIITVGWQFSW